jgi:sugar lactone lactonase YvrE
LAAAIDVASIKSRRTANVEIAFKSPHRRPNGLQATPEGLWVLDQREENFVSLVSFADGRVIREFQVSGLAGASGLTVDDEGTMWINDTHNSVIVACSAQDGKIIAKYWCIGAGRAYRLKGDPPTSRSPMPPAFEGPEAPAAAGSGDGPRRRARLPYGQLPLDTKEGISGEGGQGMEFRDGLLYYACLPTRKLYVVNAKTWEVQATWDLPGNRAHGVGWEGDTLWVSDTNWMAFFRHDMKTGEIVEKIQLTDKDPQIHGVTVHDGRMWYCDEMGYICNFKL